MPELRRDPITRDWVIIASERARRPGDLASHEPGQEVQDAAACPFCPGHESMTPPEILAFRDPGSQRNSWRWRAISARPERVCTIG
jgi:UDPglucose--hexose-1-phosphate uridylyltransferase